MKATKPQYVEGDLFAALKEVDPDTTVYVPHVCNDQGGWGAGFVVPLGIIFPKTREAYLDWLKLKPKDAAVKYGAVFELGHTQFISVQEKPVVVVANMVAQTFGGIRPLFYNHLVTCMESVASRIIGGCEMGMYDIDHVKIMAPFFGSGLAGGDPTIVAYLIHDCWARRGFDVTIFYRLGTIPEDWTPPV